MKKIMDPNSQRNNNFMTTLVKIIKFLYYGKHEQ